MTARPSFRNEGGLVEPEAGEGPRAVEAIGSTVSGSNRPIPECEPVEFAVGDVEHDVFESTGLFVARLLCIEIEPERAVETISTTNSGASTV